MWYKIGTQVGEYSLQPPTPWMFVVSTRRKHVNSPSGERGGVPVIPDFSTGPLDNPLTITMLCLLTLPRPCWIPLHIQYTVMASTIQPLALVMGPQYL